MSSITPITENTLMLKRARAAFANPDLLEAMSRGQVAAIAFVFNRPELLRRVGLTMAQALGRFEQDEIDAIAYAAWHLHNPLVD